MKRPVEGSLSRVVGKQQGVTTSLTLEGVTVIGRFAYVTDLLKGEYTFEIDANENSTLLGETTTDLPS